MPYQSIQMTLSTHWLRWCARRAQRRYETMQDRATLDVSQARIELATLGVMREDLILVERAKFVPAKWVVCAQAPATLEQV